MAEKQTFIWLNKQGVRSSEGIELQRSGRFEFTYREADRVMKLEGESIYEGLEGWLFGFGFYDSWRTARWEPPHQAEVISDPQRAQIKTKIQDATSFMDGKAEFD